MRIKELREDREIKQIEIAKILGVSQTNYSKYELGKVNIPNEMLIKLAFFYNTSIDYLLGLTNEILPYPRTNLSIKK